jgi:hypothetical protein
MERQKTSQADTIKLPAKISPVKAVISWLVEVDREYRVAQSMVNEKHDKI